MDTIADEAAPRGGGGGALNVLMLSGDIAVAQGRRGVFDNTLRLLSSHWDRIDVVCPRAPGSAPRALYGNVFVHPSPWHKALQALHAVRAGRRLLRERRYALIVSHDYSIFSNGLAAWWLSRGSGVPYVSELHHIEGYPRAATRQEAVYRRLARLYVPFAARRAAAFRTVNRVQVPEFLRGCGVPEDRILVLPSLYLDFEVFRPLPDEPKLYDVLFVGRLAANKGVGTILEAVARLRPRGRTVRVCLLGEGPLREEIARQVVRLGLGDQVTSIDRLPAQEDVAVLYNRARVLVCASTGEGGPRVAVEAMACGTPVITTPVGIMPELIEDGRNGLFFHWDADELAARIELVLGDEALRDRLGEAGRRSVAGYRAEAVVGQVAAAYRALAEDARAASPAGRRP